MANPTVLIEIEAADKTKAATESATKDVKKLGEQAKRSMQQAQAASESYKRELTEGLSRSFAIASALIVGSIMLIKKAFDEVNASAERMGRTDITKATKTAADNVQLMLDKAQEASGVYDVFANLSTVYAAFVKSILMASTQVFGFALQKVGEYINSIEGRVNKVIDSVNAIGARLNLPAIPRLSLDLEVLGDTAIMAGTSMWNFGQNLATFNTAADNTVKTMDKMTKAADKVKDKSADMANAAKTLYGGLLSTLQNYLKQKKALEMQGTDDTEDAIRNGDARALAQAKKARAAQIAQMEQDKKDALKQLVLGLIDTSTLAGAKKAAEFMGMGGEFNTMLGDFRKQYGNQEIGAGGTVGQAVSGKKWESMTGNTNVTVYIGNEVVDDHVRTVVARDLFQVPGGGGKTKSSNGQSSKPKTGKKANP